MDVSGGYKLHSVPPPGSGILIAFFMKLLGNYPNRSDALATYQRMIEAFKHGYAKRTILGDPVDPTVTKQVEEVQKIEEYNLCLVTKLQVVLHVYGNCIFCE